MGMSITGHSHLACVYVGNHHWCQTCISTCLFGDDVKEGTRTTERAVTDTYPPSPTPPHPALPLSNPVDPCCSPYPNPTPFPHRSEDSTKQTPKAIHHSRLSSRVHSSGNTFQTSRLECDWRGEGQWKNDGGGGRWGKWFSERVT